MHSASPQGAAVQAAPSRRSASAVVNVPCRRLGGRETPIDHAATKMFQHGNTSCGMCGDQNGGQFPCKPKKP